METGLEGRQVLVTGASGGIGSVTAELLAEEGARPWLHFGRSEASARELARRLEERSGAAPPLIRADLSAGSDLDHGVLEDRFRQTAEAAGGPLTGLVVNAGVWQEESRPLWETPLEQWRETLEVNLTGAFLCCRAFLRLLAEIPEPERPEDPAIVLVGSTAGVYGEAGHGDYAASKAALTGLLLTLKNEIVQLSPRGRANLVAPGWVATPMAEAALADRSVVATVTATMALRKIATSEDVARAVVFLLSPLTAGHLSGSVLEIAGGMEGRLLHPPEHRT